MPLRALEEADAYIEVSTAGKQHREYANGDRVQFEYGLDGEPVFG